MSVIPGKFKNSEYIVFEGIKFYKYHKSDNVAHCAYWRVKCKANIKKSKDGKWEMFGSHENHTLNKTRNLENEKKATDEILSLCRENYNANQNAIFKEVIQRYLICGFILEFVNSLLIKSIIVENSQRQIAIYCLIEAFNVFLSTMPDNY